jgi:hypothetical protein
MCRVVSGKVGFMRGANISYAGPVNENLHSSRATVIAALLALQTSRSKWSLMGWQLEDHGLSSGGQA